MMSETNSMPILIVIRAAVFTIINLIHRFHLLFDIIDLIYISILP